MRRRRFFAADGIQTDSAFAIGRSRCNLIVLMLNVFITLLLIVHVVVCLLMSVLVLMQRPRKDGLGAAFGGGMTDTVFGAHTTTVLQKGTVFLGGMFFVITLTLALLVSHQQRSLMAGDASSFLGDDAVEVDSLAPAPDEADEAAPVATDPVLPPLPGDESQEEAAPEAPADSPEPSEPQEAPEPADAPEAEADVDAGGDAAGEANN